MRISFGAVKKTKCEQGACRRQTESQRWMLKMHRTERQRDTETERQTRDREYKASFNRQEKEVKMLPRILLHFPEPDVKVMRNILSSSPELGILFRSCSPWFHFVQNKQLNFSKIINEETFKALELHIIVTSAILPPPHMVILGYIFYFFDPKGHFCKLRHQRKGETDWRILFLLVAIISPVPFLPFSSHKKTEQYPLTKSSATPKNLVFPFY